MVDVWYKQGLKFGCTGCGKCCTGSPGYVWIDEKDIATMAKFLNISPELFVQRYTRSIGGRLSLREDARNYDCIFLKGKACQIYEARPKQCKTFPWWPEQLESEASWKEAAERCEGINHPDAPLVAFGEIQHQVSCHMGASSDATESGS